MLTKTEIKKCIKNGFVWEIVKYPLGEKTALRRRGSNFRRSEWNVILNGVNTFPTKAAAKLAIATSREDERIAKRKSADAAHVKLLEDGKTQMTPITPEQGRLLRDGDPVFLADCSGGIAEWKGGSQGVSTALLSGEAYNSGYQAGLDAALAAVKNPRADSSRVFSTGATRDTDEGKPRIDLIPPEALELLGRLLAEGAKHYGVGNWEKGIPLRQFLASMMRHYSKVLAGDHSEDHDVRVLFNAMGFVVTSARIKTGKLPKELDDLGWCKEGEK